MRSKATFFRALLVAVAIGLAVIVLSRPILAIALAALGGSPAVKAATSTYFTIRILSTPFALANYVMLGWLIGLGRAALGLFLQTFLNGLNIALNITFVLGLGWGIAGSAWGTTIGEATTALLGLAIVLTRLDRNARPSLARIPRPRRDPPHGVGQPRHHDPLLHAPLRHRFFMSRGAAMGDIVLAANALLMNFYLIGGYFLDGFASAAEQFAGRSIGARFRPAFERAVKLTLAGAICWPDCWPSRSGSSDRI